MTNTDNSWLDAMGEAITHAKADAALKRAREEALAAIERERTKRQEATMAQLLYIHPA